MKNIKRILACVLALALLISNVCFAATEAETNAANQLHAYEIYKGRDGGDLALDSTITRAEIATLVLRITAQENDEPYTPQFTMTQKDVVGHWAEKNIRKVIELGYMKGYDENTGLCIESTPSAPRRVAIAPSATNADCDSETLETNSGSTTLTAQWTANTITLNWYNGDTQYPTNTCTYDSGITLPSQPTKTGYNFVGWKVKE